MLMSRLPLELEGPGKVKCRDKNSMALLMSLAPISSIGLRRSHSGFLSFNLISVMERISLWRRQDLISVCITKTDQRCFHKALKSTTEFLCNRVFCLQQELAGRSAPRLLRSLGKMVGKNLDFQCSEGYTA